MPSDTYDAIVIGAGVIGASVAYELARDGRRVCVVDRGRTPGAGSTSASSAVVRFNYSTWTGVAAAWESRFGWESWREHLEAPAGEPLARFHRTGGVCLTAPGDNRTTVLEHFRRAGIPYEEWDAQTLRQQLPGIDARQFYPPKRVDDAEFWSEPDRLLSGYWTPDAGFVDDPQLAAVNLANAARRRGAVFKLRTEVVGVRRDDSGVRGVSTSDGAELSAPVVVNVAGPHSSVVNAMAGALGDFALTTRPMRQEVHYVAAPPGLSDEAPAPLVADIDLGTYFRGAPGGGLLIGGTEPECDPQDWLDDPDAFNPNVTQDVYRSQVYRAARRLPELGVPDQPRGVAGVYDVSDDWIPIYDKTCVPGYFVAIGTSGNQFKNAPVVGRFLAELVSATELGHDHDSDPVQVKLAASGLVADLGHYSRRRRINRSSSFSVLA